MREKVVNFLREVRGEFQRISWPSRAEIIGLTTLVIIIVVLLSIYVGLWDFIFQRVVAFLLQRR
ncbi:Protein translocase subunit SecE [bacterium HR07]|uniref:Protein translocase subunit SecE n=2 Tax=Candidatus Bipolaricaulota TaxID=67810 RepID=H5SJ87_9BACT|nr:preprotein translocase subunit SecE [uncultured Acetothermia bacterium]BAL58185.1 preprotein translocase subunit SecE [uncultured Acetothermia bacterium]BAL59903.1 preprotein translocase subunit SecE [Candidatus Acetothermum autotrophicum]GBC75846.1 Protein translocase subunit SecE [bacterium HR07]